MILDATTTDDQEHQNDAASPTSGFEDLEFESDESAEPSCEQSCKVVLNRIYIEENMHAYGEESTTHNFFIE